MVVRAGRCSNTLPVPFTAGRVDVEADDVMMTAPGSAECCSDAAVRGADEPGCAPDTLLGSEDCTTGTVLLFFMAASANSKSAVYGANTRVAC